MDRIERNKVGPRIQEIMRRVGITQKGLADYLNVSQPAISLYLQGRVPPADVLLKIARLGDTTVEWILTGQADLTKKVFKVEEQEITYGSEFMLHELWSQLPDDVKQSFLTLLRHFIEHSNR